MITNSVTGVLEGLITQRVASRIWTKDPSVWPSPDEGGDPAPNTLGWLQLPIGLTRLIEQFQEARSNLAKDEIKDIVVLGMGGSSMTPLTLRSMLSGGESVSPKLRVLDTVHPDAVRELSERIDPSKTLFIVASKSGSTVEPLSLESHFRELSPKTGSNAGRRNFAAFTDPGTPMSERARNGEFGTWISTPLDVGGRFSALSAFGIAPAVFSGLNLEGVANSAVRVSQECGADSPANPGLQLGAFLGANALNGKDKVTVVTPPEFAAFGLWIDQLLAESTGKHEKGLVPITGEPILSAERYSEDRQFVFIGSETEVELRSELVELGHPVLTINFDDANDIGGEFFRWEFAAAVVSSVLDIYPFDQPDVEAAKQRARDLVGAERVESTGSSVEEVVEAIGHQNAGAYISIVAFIPESQPATEAMSRLRHAITMATGIPTTFGYGPRYLHSTGQLFKGGPKNNLVIGFVSGKYDDLPIPGAEYTFGQLLNAQAQGDFAVMREVRQSVKEVYTDTDPVGVIEKITSALTSL